MEFYNELQSVLKSGKSVKLYTAMQDFDNISKGEKAFLSDTLFVCQNKFNLNSFKNIVEGISENSTAFVYENGDIKLLCETLLPKPQLVICGGGHVSLALAKICSMLDFSITVIDDRQEFANKERFSMADNVVCSAFNEALCNLPYTKNSYFTILTRGHSCDADCLREILKHEHAYVGMIGSKRKNATVKTMLENEGTKKALLDSVYAPIGLSIGAQTPSEIAVCIAAQLIEIKSKQNLSSAMDSDMLSAYQKGSLCATVISKKGSAPRDAGAKMIFLPDGATVGTVGGGAAEYEICQSIHEAVKNGALVKSFNMTNEDAAKSGMICGGIIDVWLEKL